MFTVAQIKAIHSKVKSGAEFPAYIQEIKKLGVKSYEVLVIDGRSNYYGADNYQTSSEAKYDSLTLAQMPNIAQFKQDLVAHQQGKTNYMTFCNDCAKSGIEKWVVCMEKMTCTYYDVLGNEVLIEQIPQ